MTSQHTSNLEEYLTSELKLAALIMAEVPDCSFDVSEQENSVRKVIRIKYLPAYRIQVGQIEKDLSTR